MQRLQDAPLIRDSNNEYWELLVLRDYGCVQPRSLGVTRKTSSRYGTESKAMIESRVYMIKLLLAAIRDVLFFGHLVWSVEIKPEDKRDSKNGKQECNGQHSDFLSWFKQIQSYAAR